MYCGNKVELSHKKKILWTFVFNVLFVTNKAKTRLILRNLLQNDFIMSIDLDRFSESKTSYTYKHFKRFKMERSGRIGCGIYFLKSPLWEAAIRPNNMLSEMA